MKLSSSFSTSLANSAFAPEFEFVARLAREAATIVNTFYIGSSEVRYKGEDEPVTEADRSANQHILTRIQARFPDDGVLSEESKDDLARLEKERVWIVDPLDGTKDFIARNGEFSVMIGLAVQNQSVLGIIMQPATGQLYAGVQGVGAFMLESDEPIPLTVSDVHHVNRMVMVSSRSHRLQITDRIRKALHINSERVSGSVGLKVGLIVRHLAELYVAAGPGLREWDLCAPSALLHAAGGKMTDCWGAPLLFNQQDVRAHNGVIASNGRCHGEIVETVASVCTEFGYNQDDGFW